MNAPLKVPPARVVFTEEDIRDITRRLAASLRSGALTLGANGREFEAEFARITARQHAVAVNSGTSALEIALRALGVAGREVVVPANTFFATAAAAVHAGAKVRFADVERTTLALDLATLDRQLNEHTAAVILVHIGGVVSPDTPAIVARCAERGIPCIEDAAHAAGAALAGKPAGSFGIAASFSFYPTKIITSGEGGMLVTNDERLAREARIYLDQGKAGFTQNLHTRMGYNWRLSEPHAAIGLTHLSHLSEFISERTALARRYDAGLAGIEGVRALRVPAACTSNYYKYLAWLDAGVDRAALKRRLREEHGVGLAGEVYELPLHLQPVFDGIAPLGSLPVAEEVCARHICLPIYQGMSEGDVERVVAALGAVLSTR
jgi:perosamine synthetase